MKSTFSSSRVHAQRKCATQVSISRSRAVLRHPPALGGAPGAARSRAHCVIVQASTVPVTFSVNKQTEYGEVVKLVGNQPFMGNWEPQRASHLKWNEGHVWQGTFDVPVGVDVAFKVILAKDDGSSVWEGGDDRTFKALGPDFALTVSCKWDDTGSTRIKAVPLSEAGSSSPAQRSVDNGWTPPRRKTPGPSSQGLSSLEEDARQTSSWVGAAPEFVRSRLDKGSRQGTWRTDGLQGVELDLVRGDQDNSNWLGKLGLMKSLLVDRPHMLRPHMEELSACYVYATWINTGAIRCVETGGHHRPNHHANHALQMFRSLEWAIGDASLGEGGNNWPPEARILAARRMHMRLPSISGEYRVSTPLTRIRDIAHRNDIPKDLKDEIKHTLQNKLHRSAGPEDLVASEAMLARVTAQPGQYSGAFVEEFKIFIKELRDFFNASGLSEILDVLQPSLDDQHKAVVNQFKEAMARLDATPGDQDPPANDLMNALFMGTQARGYFVSGLSAGLRNDVGDDVLATRQRWRLADIRLEEYMFVLLARVLGQLEKAGGAATLGKANSSAAWKVAVGATVQGLRQLGLSGFATRELLALENEIEAWLASFAAGGASAKRENALRGKACAERVQRLASQYSDLVMSVYDAPAKRLGHALDVPEHMARVFGESEVRASVAFQVSRLATLMSKALRDAANMDAWDGLVTGEGHGRLVAVDSITPSTMDQACQGHDDDVVLLVHRADGDEEVGAHPRLAGVVLCQELPHLSHLGVRARQEKVTFATCDDPEYVNQRIKPLLGRTVKLTVAPDGVSLKEDSSRPAAKRAAPAATAAPSNGKGTNGHSPSVGSSSMASTVRATQLSLVPLVEAQVNTCGSKAARCGDLERLARGPGKGLFSTPRGAVLPFGSMELVLEQAGRLKEFQACVRELERPDLLGASLDQECERATDIISGVTLPANLLKQVQSSFGGGALLAVRSSANVEDLAGMSAAGLYESKVGVPVDDPTALNEAVCEVWASLFARRAVLSRRAGRVGQADACMAVLIMELVAPDVSFVLHTARPSDANTNVMMAELAPGQGETLASGTRGTPWRLEVDKSTSKVEVLAFANFSRALVVPGSLAAGSTLLGSSRSGSAKGLRYSSFDEQQGGGGGGVAAPPRSEPRGGLVEVEVDYSKQRLSTDSEYREQVARQLARVGMLVEKNLGGEPQDIEGGLVPSQTPGQMSIYVLQTRPQPL